MKFPLNRILGYTTYSDLGWNRFASNKSVLLLLLLLFFQNKLISSQTITTKTVTVPISRHLGSRFRFCRHLWLLIAVTMVTVWIMIKFISNFKCWIARSVFKISTFSLFHCLNMPKTVIRFILRHLGSHSER